MPCLGRVRIFKLRSGKLIGEYCNYTVDDCPRQFTKIIVGLRLKEYIYSVLDMIAKSYFCNGGMFMELMLKFYDLCFPSGVEDLIDKCYFYDVEGFRSFGIVVQRSVGCLSCDSQVYLLKVRCSNCLSL